MWTSAAWAGGDVVAYETWPFAATVGVVIVLSLLAAVLGFVYFLWRVARGAGVTGRVVFWGVGAVLGLVVLAGMPFWLTTAAVMLSAYYVTRPGRQRKILEGSADLARRMEAWLLRKASECSEEEFAEEGPNRS